jgi:diguanylate cyclase (GGDEF)-like protein/PAS domain S-box-containing protein
VLQRDGGAAVGDDLEWHRVTIAPLHRGTAAVWLVTAVDITDLKAAMVRLEAQLDLQTNLVNMTEDCIKVISPSGRLVAMNNAGCRSLGVPVDSSFGMEWLKLLPERVFSAGESALAEARAGFTARFTGYSELEGNELKVWDNALTPICAADGTVTSIVCVSRDITREHVAVEGLRLSQERLLVATRMGGLGLWDYDLANDVLSCDETWHTILGGDPAHPVRKLADFRPFIHPEDVERVSEVRETAAELIASNRDYATTFRIVRPNGTQRWVRSAACLLKNIDGQPIRAVGFIVDVTETIEGERALKDSNHWLETERTRLMQETHEDPLTRVPNRRALDQEMARVCLRAQRAHDSVVVGMIDIDYFKRFNDHYGHLEGDKVLRRVAAALTSAARRSDFIARYGGEEFAFVLESMEAPSAAIERLIEAVARLQIPHAASPLGRLTVSLGAVVAVGGDMSAEALLRSADAVLYLAKAAGRNCWMMRTFEEVLGDSPDSVKREPTREEGST